MTKRAAISLPDQLYSRMERDRKTRRVPRSRWIQEAVHEYLAKRDEEKDVRAYFEGYRRFPETDEEFRALERAGLEDLKRADLE
ncbi:MAG: hypothetical protein AUI58_04175 [Chloroflexi bacterium 13_1_40CM_2_70_6]|nr:MAG: hypothetical protein AUI58_04175 [Chloroflexi bacterium 13_1_40CM_2_70_6]OLE77769.1 MAG: hypothetical protein AUG02_00605 [Chloroflexi bacterium 13_1_20CM_2_70_9]